MENIEKENVETTNIFLVIYDKHSKTSLCGHLSKVDISVLWTPFGLPKLFLLEMNLLNVDTSLFWTVDTFFPARL